jgi:PadR family transcriptional regulator, regulatory protein AphA
MRGKSTTIGPLSPEFALLGLLARGVTHGYELHQKLVDDLGQIWHVSLSQTYNILNRLEEKGYITGETQEQDKLPSRRNFHITPSGKERFETWLHTASGVSVKAIRVEFLTRLYFARSVNPELAHEILAKQIQETRLGVDRLNRIAESLHSDSEFNRLAVDLRIQQLKSILSWLDKCKSFLASKGNGG